MPHPATAYFRLSRRGTRPVPSARHRQTGEWQRSPHRVSDQHRRRMMRAREVSRLPLRRQIRSPPLDLLERAAIGRERSCSAGRCPGSYRPEQASRQNASWPGKLFCNEPWRHLPTPFQPYGGSPGVGKLKPKFGNHWRCKGQRGSGVKHRSKRDRCEPPVVHGDTGADAGVI